MTSKLFAYIAPQYELSYKAIEGNLYTGITLKDLRFKNQPMAQKVTLKYNPNALLFKEFQISKLQIEDADIDVIKEFISSFKTKIPEQKQDNTKEKHPDLDLTIKAKDISITVRPFKEQGIKIDHASVEAKALMFKLQDYKIEAEGFHIDVQSNLGEIEIVGDIEKDVLQINTLSIERFDIESIRKILNKKQSEEKHVPKKQKNDKNFTLEVPFHYLIVKKAVISVLPTIYDKIKIERARLNVKKLEADIKLLRVDQGILSLNISTDLGDVTFTGNITHNKIESTSTLLPKPLLYSRYNLPLRREAIKKIDIDINASKEKVVADMALSAKAILEVETGAFNFDIDDLNSHMTYKVDSGALKVDSNAHISTPYVKNIYLTNLFNMDQNISYSGEVQMNNFTGIDQNISAIFKDLNITYKGTSASIETKLQSRYFKGNFSTNDMKKGILHLYNSRSLKLASFLSLPKNLQASEIKEITIDAPVNFEDFSQTKVAIHLDSNIVTMNMNGEYGKKSKMNAIVEIPKNSLLRIYQPKIKWNQFTPLKIDMGITGKQAVLNTYAKAFNTKVIYKMIDDKIDGIVKIGGMKLSIKGVPKQHINVLTKVNNLKELRNSINAVYTMNEPLPPLEGAFSINMKIEGMKKLALILKSPKVVYHPKRGKKQRIDDIELILTRNDSVLEVSSYRAIYNKQKFFATMPSRVSMKENKISIAEFWINDTLKISGAYDLKLAQGEFKAKADRFHIKDSMADIYTKIDIDTILEGKNTTVKGKIILLGGMVSPDVQSKSFASDSDILILQELKKKKENAFMKHLTVMLKLESEKPIIFKQPDTYVKLKPDLTIIKEPGGKLLYLGSVILLEGGYYRFEDKKFILKKSHVYFIGDINKPMLDIKATYQSLKYLITITVGGTPSAPVINFSSSPSLSREQILSVILFDTEEGGDTHSGDEMMRMMGGAMAKAALSDMGVKVDHLVFGENGSIEVGKKLTNKITVIYINGDVPEIKLKYRHSKHTESVISVSPKSESYDIIFKGDF